MNNKKLMEIFRAIANVDCITEIDACVRCKFCIEEFSDDGLQVDYKCLLVKVASIILNEI